MKLAVTSLAGHAEWLKMAVSVQKAYKHSLEVCDAEGVTVVKAG